MLDIHTHLYWKDFDADREDVIARAFASGITRMVSVGTDLETSRQAIEVAGKYPQVFAAVGIHPHEFNAEESRITNQESRWESVLEKLAQHKKVVAVGECGLDFYEREVPLTEAVRARQREGFLVQLQIADKYRLPVIIHCRNAYEEVYEILKDHNSQFSTPDSRSILHCYQGDTDITKKFLELPNVFFSFTGNITYPVKQALAGTRGDLTETVKLVPLDRLFTETDCPFLAPQERRGERNEPSFVRYVAERAAEIHKVSVDEVTGQVDYNFKQVFGV